MCALVAGRPVGPGPNPRPVLSEAEPRDLARWAMQEIIRLGLRQAIGGLSPSWHPRVSLYVEAAYSLEEGIEDALEDGESLLEAAEAYRTEALKEPW